MTQQPKRNYLPRNPTDEDRRAFVQALNAMREAALQTRKPSALMGDIELQQQQPGLDRLAKADNASLQQAGLRLAHPGEDQDELIRLHVDTTMLDGQASLTVHGPW